MSHGLKGLTSVCSCFLMVLVLLFFYKNRKLYCVSFKQNLESIFSLRKIKDWCLVTIWQVEDKSLHELLVNVTDMFILLCLTKYDVNKWKSVVCAYVCKLRRQVQRWRFIRDLCYLRQDPGPDKGPYPKYMYVF